jgi:hypothetical protein
VKRLNKKVSKDHHKYKKIKRFFSLTSSEWESSFFKKKMGLIHTDDAILKASKVDQVIQALKNTIHQGEKEKYNILQLIIDSSLYELMLYILETGFFLVDTQIIFRTEIVKSLLPVESYLTCRAVNDNDLPEIIKLTHDSFTNNPDFYSRYKNLKYFTHSQTKNYYEVRAKNYIYLKNSISTVCEAFNNLLGFTIISPIGSINNMQLYKVILSAVKANYKGKGIYSKLSNYSLNQIPGNTFLLENTTQLNNIPMLKNYLKLNKSLHKIEYICYYQF